MPPSSLAPYLTDIIEAIEHVREKAGATPLDAFKEDWEQQWIVQRGLEIVSEVGGGQCDPLSGRQSVIDHGESHTEQLQRRYGPNAFRTR